MGLCCATDRKPFISSVLAGDPIPLVYGNSD